MNLTEKHIHLYIYGTINEEDYVQILSWEELVANNKPMHMDGDEKINYIQNDFHDMIFLHDMKHLCGKIFRAKCDEFESDLLITTKDHYYIFPWMVKKIHPTEAEGRELLEPYN